MNKKAEPPYEFQNLSQRALQHLDREQQRAFRKVTQAHGGIIWWKVGEGKTRIALFWFAILQNVHCWHSPSICVIVCRRKAFRDWQDEIQRIVPECCAIEDRIPEGFNALHPTFLFLSDGMVAKAVNSLSCPYIRAVIIDELWMYANPKSARSKAIRKLTLSRRSIGLSGTVMKAGDLIDIYGQTFAVQQHRLLANSPTAFRSKFQITDLNAPFPRFYPKPGAYQQIMSSLDGVADVHFPSTRIRIHEQHHTIDSTSEQRELFASLRKFYEIEFKGHSIEYNNALQISAKIQSIANGWFKNEGGEIVSVKSNKPEKLRDELSDIVSAGERAIVWCAFRYDVEMLSAYLPFATLQMVGGSEFDVDTWRSGRAKVCLATEASGSSINHFEQIPYALYFSCNWKWLDMQQSRGRTARKSSRHKDCFYKYLSVAGSIDKKIYSAVMANRNKELSLIACAGIKEWLNE